MRRRSRAGRRATAVAAVGVALVAAAACGGQQPAARPSADRSSTTSLPTASPTPTPTPTPSPTPTRTPTPASSPSPHDEPDPRWRFYTDDKAWHTSPWFAGAHRVMIGYGCTTAPWYSPDGRCPGGQGFHHGIDVAMPCGTPLLSAVDGVVLDPSEPGAPGSAYGAHPFRIRSGDHDILIGHTTRVFVQPGEHVRRGQRIARAGDSGAPDGCHLHLEVRRAGGGLSTATDPSELLALSGG